jgi:hypothetical protein
MTLFLMLVCFAVVVRSAFNHLNYLEIDTEYILSSSRRANEFC